MHLKALFLRRRREEDGGEGKGRKKLFMSYFLAFVFILLHSDFNMFDVLYDMLVSHLAHT